MSLNIESFNSNYPCEPGVKGIDFLSLVKTHGVENEVFTHTESGRPIRFYLSRDRIWVEDLGIEGYRLICLLKNNMLWLNLRTDSKLSESQDYNAKKFVIASRVFFESNRQKVDGLKAFWGPESINYIEYQENKRNRLTSSQSAFETWTGRLCKSKLDCENVDVVRDDSARVDVVFRRKI